MVAILFFVFCAFIGYLYCYKTGMLKQKKRHIMFALMAFACEFNAVYLMTEKFKEVHKYSIINEDVLLHHIVFSCIFLLLAVILIITGLALVVRNGENLRYSHRIFVPWFFITWVLATGSGLYILY